MLYGVLGDIHGNREALEAALAFLGRRGAQRLLCLGDIVGYNADPDECVAMMRERRVDAVAGNHDLIGTGSLGFERCTDQARYSLQRTRKSLAPEYAAWLGSLPPARRVDQHIVLVHAGVRSVEQPMLSAAHIELNARFLAEHFPDARLCFFGHTHEQTLFEVRAEGARGISIPGQKIFLDRDALHFVNPGSVDASRKNGRKLAECALFDSSDGSLEFHRLPYDAASAEAKAAVFGFRMNRWTERFYELKRKLFRIPGRAAAP
jgi:predicted phosphodiesterase